MNCGWCCSLESSLCQVKGGGRGWGGEGGRGTDGGGKEEWRDRENNDTGKRQDEKCYIYYTFTLWNLEGRDANYKTTTFIHSHIAMYIAMLYRSYNYSCPYYSYIIV